MVEAKSLNFVAVTSRPFGASFFTSFADSNDLPKLAANVALAAILVVKVHSSPRSRSMMNRTPSGRRQRVPYAFPLQRCQRRGVPFDSRPQLGASFTEWRSPRE